MGELVGRRIIRFFRNARGLDLDVTSFEKEEYGRGRVESFEVR